MGKVSFAVLLLLLSLNAFASRVHITTTSLPNGSVGVPYRARVNAMGGCTPYVWSTGTLPRGLSSSPSSSTTSLNIAGTQTLARTYRFSVSVKGCGGHVSTASYAITIANHVHITTANLPNGTVGVPYRARVNATGGCTPYAWSTGTLPPGLSSSLSASTTSLNIEGTQRLANTYRFSVSVKGCGGHVSTASYAITAAPSQPPPTQVSVTISPTATTLAPGGTQQFTAYVSGTSNTAVTWRASGGSVTSSGLYTAPSSPGNYSVTTTSLADPTESATAADTVLAPSQHTVNLSWVASTSTDVTGYNVFRATTSGGPYMQINSALDRGLNYVDATVVSGVTYYYVLTAQYSSGIQSTYSTQASASVPYP